MVKPSTMYGSECGEGEGPTARDRSSSESAQVGLAFHRGCEVGGRLIRS